MKFLPLSALVAFQALLANAAVAPGRSLASTTELSNGAEVTINITSPYMFQNFTNIVNTTMAFNGTASVGKGIADVAYIYIIDESGSMADPDAPCDSKLECVQEFFHDFTNQAITDGSAELIAVMTFSDSANVRTGFLKPTDPAIGLAIDAAGTEYMGGTNCVDPLLKAAELVQEATNTAGTTIVVFAGDGECNVNEALPDAIDTLAATGAIVHTVAIGDAVECDEENAATDTTAGYADYYENDLGDIPSNGGTCTSVPDPHTLTNYIDDLIGTTLESLEVKIDQGNYTDISSASSLALPQEGAIAVDFVAWHDFETYGDHEICVRVASTDSLGDATTAEECHTFTLEAPPSEKNNKKTVALGVSLPIVAILLAFLVRFLVRSASKKEPMPEADPNDYQGHSLDMEEKTDSKTPVQVV